MLIDSREFNDLVNMTADELETWLKDEQSESSGWTKGDGSDETVGHERHVVACWIATDTMLIA